MGFNFVVSSLHVACLSMQIPPQFTEPMKFPENNGIGLLQASSRHAAIHGQRRSHAHATIRSWKVYACSLNSVP